jgi:hypothetical protein
LSVFKVIQTRLEWLTFTPLKKQGQTKINSRLNSVQGGNIEKSKQGKSMKNSEAGLLNIKVGLK